MKRLAQISLGAIGETTGGKQLGRELSSAELERVVGTGCPAGEPLWWHLAYAENT